MASVNIIQKKVMFEYGRADAEYFHPDIVGDIGRLHHYLVERVGDFANVTDGIHSSPDIDDSGSGVVYLSAKSVRNNEITVCGTLNISWEQHKNNKRSSLEPGDVIISTVGTIGNAAVVTEYVGTANCDRHLGIIRIKETADVSPFYVSAFLNCRYGKMQSHRESTGNVQLNLFIEKIKTIQVPRLKCEQEVSFDVEQAIQCVESAKARLRELEEYVESVVFVSYDRPTLKKTYEAQLGEISAEKRVDAEYYQPAKKECVDILSSDGGEGITKHFDVVRQIFNPRSHRSDERVINYDLTDALEPFLGADQDLEEVGDIGSSKWIVKSGDLVISRLRSYLKEVSLVVGSSSVTRVCSSEFIVLRPKKGGELSVSTALAFLRCSPVQLILHWSQDGSNHPRFSRKELDDICIPNRVANLDGYIHSIIGESVDALRRGRGLLQNSLRKIENEIDSQ